LLWPVEDRIGVATELSAFRHANEGRT
jgi:hypothetical protein